MTDERSGPRYRFGVFEADASTGELRRQGIRIKLHGQPFQLLLMFLENPGKLLTREDIARALWPDGTFVDSEHGVNSAINRIREALRDTANNPRFIETLARRGYRFIAQVERLEDGAPARAAESAIPPQAKSDASPAAPQTNPEKPEGDSWSRILATPEDLPKAPFPVVQTIFVLLQFMYLGFYIGALANLTEISSLIAALPQPEVAFVVLIVTAAILIPVRVFVITAAFFRAPRLRDQFLRLWPFLLPLDLLWALSPFLLLHHIHFGVALACVPFLVYSPFAQRSLVLMGAGTVRAAIPQQKVESR
jgi:DNA-binding winged helix-turn-helix (wHTH) protein